MQTELLPALVTPQGVCHGNIGWKRMNPVGHRLLRTWVRRMGSPFLMGDMKRKEDQWMGRMDGQGVCCLYANPHDEDSCGFLIRDGDVNLFLITGISKYGEELCRESIAWKSAIHQILLNPPGDEVCRLVTGSPASDAKRRNALLEAGFRPISRDSIDDTKIWYMYIKPAFSAVLPVTL